MRRLCIGKGFDRAIVNSVCVIGAFIMFIVAHYVGTDLSVARIFSSIEVLFSFKHAMDMLSISLEEYYNGMVVLKRFADIFNTEQRTMIQIESKANNRNTDEPIKKGKLLN
jgi:ABC-type multidrug transport system fused ATPase/permease subunit